MKRKDDFMGRFVSRPYLRQIVVVQVETIFIRPFLELGRDAINYIPLMDRELVKGTMNHPVFTAGINSLG